MDKTIIYDNMYTVENNKMNNRNSNVVNNSILHESNEWNHCSCKNNVKTNTIGFKCDNRNNK